MDHESLWVFAQKSVTEVSAIAAQLGVKESQASWQHGRNRNISRQLAKLAGTLLLTYFNDAKFEVGKADKSSERTEMFLEALERLCAYPSEPRKRCGKELSSQYPVLSALIESSECEPWLLGSKLITKVEMSLKAFVSNDEKAIRRYFDYLKRFSSTKEHAKKNEEAIQADMAGNSRAAMEAPDDYPVHVHQVFYNTLKRYMQYCCPGQPGCSGRHDGKLRLRENFKSSNDNVIFDTVVSRIPRDKHGIEWQHLQFHISKSKKTGVKAVGFASEDTPVPTTNTSKSQYADAINTTADFCGLVRKRVGPAKLRVKVSGQALLPFRDLEGLDDDVAHEQTIALSDVLRRQALDSKEKLLVAYILARSFWQFYNSDWMCAQWMTESVQFFRIREQDVQNSSLLAVSPYFAFSFERHDTLLSNEYLEALCVVHRYPRVLALASLLYEIGCPRNTARKEEFGSVEERISNEFNNIRSGLKERGWPFIKLQKEVRQTYKVIVENCLDPKLFEPGEGSPGDFTIDERRSILHRKIVYPLQTLLQKLGWIDDRGNIRRKEDEDLNITDFDSEPSSSLIQATFLDVTKPLESPHASSNSLKWLQRIQLADITSYLVNGFKGKQSPRRVRIAVLDTGYDPGVIMFQNPHHKRRIRGWKDFTTESGAEQDEDGHGTHILSLVMKIAPAADIYIARVARDTKDLESSAKNIGEAITWAAIHCEVDIISMSFGFDEEPPHQGDRVISNAISTALGSRKQQILFFAAAANGGGNQREMFPASHPQVMSVRGTDAGGWLERFSPPPGDNGTCFMTLGKDVPGAGRSCEGSTEVCKSGTSTSTPIAAGIAAMVLCYARLQEGVLEERCGGAWQSSKLWTSAGMSCMLREMSTRMPEGCFYLSADSFIVTDDEGRLAMIVGAVNRIGRG